VDNLGFHFFYLFILQGQCSLIDSKITVNEPELAGNRLICICCPWPVIMMAT